MNKMTFVNHRGLAAIAVATLGLNLIASAALAADYTMKIGFTTINDPYNDIALRFEEEIEARSAGKIDVQLYPAGQLGTAARQIEGLQIGTQEMLISPPGFFAGIHPAMQVLDAPGMFQSMDHAEAVLADPELGQAFYTLLEPAGIQVLTLWPYGPSAIATVKEVTGLESLQGAKIRVLASPLEQELASAIGMTGVSMDFTEALPALQTGTIDGVRTALSVMGGMSFYSTAKYALKEETGMILGGAYASKLWLDSLPEELRNMVVETVQSMQGEAAQFGKDGYAASDQEWRDAGVTLVELLPEERAKLFETVSPIGAKLLAKDEQTVPMWEVFTGALARNPAQ